LSHPLDGCHAKLFRAYEHFGELDADIGRFYKSETHRIVDEFDEDSGWYRFTLAVDVQPPLRWSVLLGDWLHNLRSALDHLAWELVKHNGGSPGVWTGFPICLTSHAFLDAKGGQRQLAGMSREARALVERVQPFQGKVPDYHPLRVLQQLSNSDKHRTVAPVLAIVRPADAHDEAFTVESNLPPIDQRLINIIGQPLNDGAPLLALRFKSKPTIKLRAVIPVQIAFGEDHEITGYESLKGLGNYVGHVFGLIRPLFDMPSS
jgi:hypothetical protein